MQGFCCWIVLTSYQRSKTYRGEWRSNSVSSKLCYMEILHPLQVQERIKKLQIHPLIKYNSYRHNFQFQQQWILWGFWMQYLWVLYLSVIAVFPLSDLLDCSSLKIKTYMIFIFLFILQLSAEHYPVSWVQGNLQWPQAFFRQSCFVHYSEILEERNFKPSKSIFSLI